MDGASSHFTSPGLFRMYKYTSIHIFNEIEKATSKEFILNKLQTNNAVLVLGG